MVSHKDEVIRGLSELQEAAHGIVDIRYVDLEAAGALLIAAAMGDHQSLQIVKGIGKVMVWMKKQPRKKPALCLCCPREIRTETDICGFVLISVPENQTAPFSVSAICDACAIETGRDDKVLSAIQKHIWPNARIIQISDTFGTS